MQKKNIVFFLTFCLVLVISSTAFAKDAIRFATPPWPGVTVKTEVVCQISESLGYETEQLQVGPPIIYKGMPQGDVDVYLAAWVPAQNDMLNPVLEEGSVEILGTNLDEAIISLCVPTKTWEEGVRSVADLDKYADKFDHTIYNIEAGSGMHTAVDEMIKANADGLGDWEQVASTTPIMLGQARDKMRQNEAVVFGCWKPHWMDVLMDIKFLEGTENTTKLVSQSKVHTIANADFDTRYPQLAKFLSQLYVTAETQSMWIHDYGYKEEDPADVARRWITDNQDIVAKWLEGVKTPDGRDATEVVAAAFK